LCKQAFTPGAVDYEPYIYSGNLHHAQLKMKRIEDAAAAKANAETATQQHNELM